MGPGKENRRPGPAPNSATAPAGTAEFSQTVNDPESAFGLLRALRNTAVSVIYQDLDLKVIWAENVPEAWSSGSIVGLTDHNFLPAHAAKLMAEKKAAVLGGSGPNRLEIHIPAGPGRHDRWFNLWIDADMGPAGDTLCGLVTTAVDITDQKQREQTLKVLLREVSHRSRNLLAIIQSIATQTGRHASTVDGFLQRFRGRLQSLAASQDLVTSSNWRGADLSELAYGQAARYSSKPHEAIRLEGDSPWLSPNAALHVGLALHELIANSISYGALSRPGGHVSLRSAIERNPEGGAGLLLVWREAIDVGSDASASGSGEKRFGSTALERLVPASLNGSAELKMEPGLLEYRLNVPPGHLEAP